MDTAHFPNIAWSGNVRHFDLAEMRTFNGPSHQSESFMSHIVSLSVGKDPVLLETRNKVLRSNGYTVISSLSSADAMRLFVAGDFDLVIFCHSIPKSERQALASAVRDHSPKTPVVVVSAGLAIAEPPADATIESGPEQLLQELPRLLKRSPGRSHLEHRRSKLE